MSNKSIQEDVTAYIENLYHHLDSFIDFTRRYNENIISTFGVSRDIKRSSSELINIRDAFMHYILYYNAEEKKSSEKALEQWCHISEHGQRAAKDQVVFFCQEILTNDLLEWLYKLEENGEHPEVAEATRRLMHEVKNTVLRIRISNANGIEITAASMEDIITQLKDKHIKYSELYYPIIKEVCYNT